MIGSPVICDCNVRLRATGASGVQEFIMRQSFGSISANGWKRAFLRSLRREVGPIVPATADSLVQRSAASAQRFFDARKQGVPDKQGLMIIGLCSLILAGYRELLSEQIDRNTAYEIVRRAFLATYRTPMKLITRFLLWVSRDPVWSLSRISLTKFGQRMYGSTMGFDQLVSSDRVDLIVTRCAFNRFFVDEGEPLLTRIFCEADRNWMDEVNSSARPIRMERPRTISTGAERCEFQHVRVTGEAGPARDVVLERRPEVAEALGREKSST